MSALVWIENFAKHFFLYFLVFVVQFLEYLAHFSLIALLTGHVILVFLAKKKVANDCTLVILSTPRHRFEVLKVPEIDCTQQITSIFFYTFSKMLIFRPDAEENCPKNYTKCPFSMTKNQDILVQLE